MPSPTHIREETDDLPDKDVARDFYAKYEPKEVLGRSVLVSCSNFEHDSNSYFIPQSLPKNTGA